MMLTEVRNNSSIERVGRCCTLNITKKKEKKRSEWKNRRTKSLNVATPGWNMDFTALSRCIRASLREAPSSYFVVSGQDSH